MLRYSHPRIYVSVPVPTMAFNHSAPSDVSKHISRRRQSTHQSTNRHRQSTHQSTSRHHQSIHQSTNRQHQSIHQSTSRRRQSIHQSTSRHRAPPSLSYALTSRDRRLSGAGPHPPAAGRLSSSVAAAE